MTFKFKKLLVLILPTLCTSLCAGCTLFSSDICLEIKKSFLDDITCYATGNFGNTFIKSCNFKYYRMMPFNEEDGGFSFFPADDNFNFKSALYNATPLKDIRKISVTYKYSSIDGDSSYIYYGENIDRQNSVEIEKSLDFVTKDFDMGNADYFMFECGTSKLIIKNIKIYSTKQVGNPIRFNKGNQTSYRINNVVCENGELESGKTKLTIPTNISVNSDDTYQITETKDLTYYSYESVKENPSLANSAALTNALDIAAYTIGFNAYPANYVYMDQYEEAYEIFGDATRLVSYYTRTDGYVKSLPLKYGEENLPHYYELDIKMPNVNYGTTSRGVGRLVWFTEGLNPELVFGQNQSKATNYSDSYVVYTDDHYSTFSEFLNSYSFGTPFNGWDERTPYEWAPAKTLTLKN